MEQTSGYFTRHTANDARVNTHAIFDPKKKTLLVTSTVRLLFLVAYPQSMADIEFESLVPCVVSGPTVSPEFGG